MRVVLADLKSDRGFVSKDTVVGGYGSRLTPFSRVTSVIAYLKRQFHDVPSVHMAYAAAILARAGHEVIWTRGGDVEVASGADVAIVLSSIVDHKNETAWADTVRARGVKVGFVGIAASKMPQLFVDHADFISTVSLKLPSCASRRALFRRGSRSASRSTTWTRCPFRGGTW